MTYDADFISMKA